VAQRFGNGRVGAANWWLWRWGLRDEATRSDQDKAWRQMIRWLIADVPERIQFFAEPKRDDPNRPCPCGAGAGQSSSRWIMRQLE
jgi:hypothetical protein